MDVALKKHRCRCAIQSNDVDARMLGAQCGNRIDAHRALRNPRIQTAGTFAFGNHIPKRHAGIGQTSQALAIGRLRRHMKQGLHQRPKSVAWMRVVLGRTQRRGAGHGTQDQGTGRKAEHGIERVHCRHRESIAARACRPRMPPQFPWGPSAAAPRSRTSAAKPGWSENTPSTPASARAAINCGALCSLP